MSALEIKGFAVPEEKLRGPRIAVLSSAMFSYHTKVLWGFLRKIESVSGLDWRPIMFFCKEPQVGIMHEQMKEIKKDGYDLILSIGALYSHVAAEHVRGGGLNVPLVFCGVADPVRLRVVPQLMPEKLITGITREQLPATYLADFLMFIKPSIKKVLIPEYPTGEFGHSVEKLSELSARFKIYGVDALLVPVYSMTEVVPAVMAHIGRVDTIILPEGTFVSELTGILSRLCREHKVTLVGHHLEQPGSNPAITFTQDIEFVGETLFHRAEDILIHKKAPEELPIITLPNDRHIIVDVQACAEQGVDLDAIALFSAYNNIIVR